MDEVQGIQIEDVLLTLFVLLTGLANLPYSLVLWIVYPVAWFILDMQQFMVPMNDEDREKYCGERWREDRLEAHRRYLDEERKRNGRGKRGRR